MIRVALLLRDDPDAVEHDLSRFHGHRTAAPGPGGPLTFREVTVRLRWLPVDAATRQVADMPPWNVERALLEDIRLASMAVARMKPEAHPASPYAVEQRKAQAAETAARAKKMADARARAKSRRQQLGQEGST